MARPAFRKVDRPEEGGPRLSHLDRDRRLVEAAQADPARFEALYRKYLAQVYSYAYYELRDHHEAEDATERTFVAALTNLPRFEERARPADGEGASTFRVWLFQIARNVVAERRRRRSRRPEAPLEAAANVAAPIDLEADAALRDDAAEAWRAVARLPGDRRRALHPALRRRDVDRRDRRGARSIRGCGPRAHPPRPAQRRARSRRPVAVTGAFAGRDSHEVDALITDRYLEGLLAAHARGADRGPALTEPEASVRFAADRLARDLQRLHPSFRFEEALAARLAEVAARMRLPVAAGGEGLVVPFSGASAHRPGDGDDEPGDDPWTGIGRPLLIGGALTSAALSIAGAAYVAWRLNRPPGSPMARAARAVARTRLV